MHDVPFKVSSAGHISCHACEVTNGTSAHYTHNARNVQAMCNNPQLSIAALSSMPGLKNAALLAHRRVSRQEWVAGLTALTALTALDLGFRWPKDWLQFTEVAPQLSGVRALTLGHPEASVTPAMTLPVQPQCTDLGSALARMPQLRGLVLRGMVAWWPCAEAIVQGIIGSHGGAALLTKLALVQPSSTHQGSNPARAEQQRLDAELNREELESVQRRCGEALVQLTGLQSLAFLGCGRVYDAGMTPLAGLPSLCQLRLTGLQSDAISALNGLKGIVSLGLHSKVSTRTVQHLAVSTLAERITKLDLPRAHSAAEVCDDEGGNEIMSDSEGAESDQDFDASNLEHMRNCMHAPFALALARGAAAGAWEPLHSSDKMRAAMHSFVQV